MTNLEVEKNLYILNIEKIKNKFDSTKMGDVVKIIEGLKKYSLEKHVAFCIEYSMSKQRVDALLIKGFDCDSLDMLKCFNNACSRMGTIKSVRYNTYSNIVAMHNSGADWSEIKSEMAFIQKKHFRELVVKNQKIVDGLTGGDSLKNAISSAKSFGGDVLKGQLAQDISEGCGDCMGGAFVGEDLSAQGCSNVATLETNIGVFNITKLHNLRGKESYLDYRKMCDVVKGIDKDAFRYLLEDAPSLSSFNLNGHLSGCFSFFQTPQGSDYWWEIVKEFYKLTKGAAKSVVEEADEDDADFNIELSNIKTKIQSLGYDPIDVEQALLRRDFCGRVVTDMKKFASEKGFLVQGLSDLGYFNNFKRSGGVLGYSLEVSTNDWYYALSHIMIFGDVDFGKYVEVEDAFHKGYFRMGYDKFIEVQRLSLLGNVKTLQNDLTLVCGTPENIDWQ